MKEIIGIESFMGVFNYYDSTRAFSNYNKKVSFSIINASSYETYESTKTLASIINSIMTRMSKNQISKRFEIMEPSVIFDYNLFVRKIECELGANKKSIFINNLDIVNRKGYKSTYSITATVYPNILTVIKDDFSLEKLYFAYLNASEEEKVLIKEILNQFEFKKIRSINYKELLNAKIENDVAPFIQSKHYIDEEIEKILKDATINASLIHMFNMEENMIDIHPGNNYYADSMYIEQNNKVQKYLKSLQSK